MAVIRVTRPHCRSSLTFDQVSPTLTCFVCNRTFTQPKIALPAVPVRRERTPEPAMIPSSRLTAMSVVGGLVFVGIAVVVCAGLGILAWTRVLGPADEKEASNSILAEKPIPDAKTQTHSDDVADIKKPEKGQCCSPPLPNFIKRNSLREPANTVRNMHAIRLGHKSGECPSGSVTRIGVQDSSRLRWKMHFVKTRHLAGESLLTVLKLTSGARPLLTRLRSSAAPGTIRAYILG
jgi:hypothetical protein